MRIGVYLCTCGAILPERLDLEAIAAETARMAGVAYVRTAPLLCSEDGRSFLAQDLRREAPDRTLVIACSPREHGATFMRAAEAAGHNPYLLHLVNVREQVAWVTPDRAAATGKALALIRGGLARVARQEPLERREIEASPDTLVVGAGPAGVKAALALAEAGRRVVLVEKSPMIGGLPVRFEELFPAMECGSCLLEPLLGELLHGEAAARIELLTSAEVIEAAGFHGNFTVRIRRQPRHVDPARCIGCGECAAACPATLPNPVQCGLGERKAIDLPYFGALPGVPTLDRDTCRRSHGEECRACAEACPLGEDLIDFTAAEEVLERRVGAVILATGGALADCGVFPRLGYGRSPRVRTSLEFERLAAGNGPAAGDLAAALGGTPRAVAIVHCVGSLDPGHRAYCSGVCCRYAFKFNRLLRGRFPEVEIVHFYRHLSVAGKGESALYLGALGDPATRLLRYARLEELSIGEEGDRLRIDGGEGEAVIADLAILCPAVIPAAGTEQVAALFDLPLDREGFFEALHGRIDAVQGKVRGVYLAGCCQEPMDIRQASLQGVAAAGHVLAGLVEGKKLTIDPAVAEVAEERCAGCKTCLGVCPFQAAGFAAEAGKAQVNAVLCRGCGTCTAACPSGAIRSHHQLGEGILAEIDGVLA